MPDIMHLVTINAPAADVYRGLTIPAGIHGWWTQDADLDPQVGGAGQFRFYGGTKVTTVAIAELDPAARVEWKVVDSFRPEWRGTQISFDLREVDGSTELRFRHSGFPLADDDYAVCTTGWGIYLGRLRDSLEAARAEAHVPSAPHNS